MTPRRQCSHRGPPVLLLVLLLACACDRVALGLGDGSDEPQLFTALPGVGAAAERGARRGGRRGRRASRGDAAEASGEDGAGASPKDRATVQRLEAKRGRRAKKGGGLQVAEATADTGAGGEPCLPQETMRERRARLRRERAVAKKGGEGGDRELMSGGKKLKPPPPMPEAFPWWPVAPGEPLPTPTMLKPEIPGASHGGGCARMEEHWKGFNPIGQAHAITNNTNIVSSGVYPKAHKSWADFCEASPRPRDTVLPSKDEDVREGGWPVAMQDVLAVVITYPGYHATRARGVVESWGSTPGLRLLVLSDETDPEVPTEAIPGLNITNKGDKAGARGAAIYMKHYAAISHVRQRMRELGCPKWIVIADDDTYLFMDRYIGLLSHLDHTKAIHAGDGGAMDNMWPRPRSEEQITPRIKYHRGGPSYAFSGPGLEVVAEAIDRGLCVVGGEYGDSATGYCAQGAQVKLVSLPGFNSRKQWDGHEKKFNRRGMIKYEDPTAFHRVQPERMVRWFREGWCEAEPHDGPNKNPVKPKAVKGQKKKGQSQREDEGREEEGE